MRSFPSLYLLKKGAIEGNLQFYNNSLKNNCYINLGMKVFVLILQITFSKIYISNCNMKGK